jgi:hypothetical protein
MVTPDVPRPCGWCRRPLPPPARTGRPRRYCSASCRQQDYVARGRATELELGGDEVIVSRLELDGLRDDLYVLRCAVDDAHDDLAALHRPTVAALRAIVDALLDAAPDHLVDRFG